VRDSSCVGARALFLPQHLRMRAAEDAARVGQFRASRCLVRIGNTRQAKRSASNHARPVAFRTCLKVPRTPLARICRWRRWLRGRTRRYRRLSQRAEVHSVGRRLPRAGRNRRQQESGAALLGEGRRPGDGGDRRRAVTAQVVGNVVDAAIASSTRRTRVAGEKGLRNRLTSATLIPRSASTSSA